MGKLPLPLEKGRAWVEIDLDALAHNVEDIRLNIPTGSEIMAIVKANAYGHGAAKIAEHLYNEGIRMFAVATLAEGVELRNSLPDGYILVFGHTEPTDAKCLNHYNLAQLVVDGVHAKELSETGYKLHVHVAIDSGMHRLGMEPSNLDEIESVFNCDNLIVDGIGTHLASQDSLDDSDIEFTNMQMMNFFSVVQELRNKGYDTGKLHAQASYGIYNFPELKCDIVRPGIMLYGVQSQNDETKIKTDLQPVLSLKARIAQIRLIDKGEHVSYGRSYTAIKTMKTATVSIGYADGVPRQMSGNGGQCIVKGTKVPIIGRICMDMLMIDVSDISDVNPGDIVTLIGKDGNEEIRCEDMAEASDTITNDILTGLGCRLQRIYI